MHQGNKRCKRTAKKTLLVTAAVIYAPAAAAPTTQPPLRFTDNGTFHISIFNDLHFGENASGQGKAWDVNTVRVMGGVLDIEQPQLVVLNGDLISGDEYKGKDIIDHIDQIVRPLVSRQLPWASTYGNHDSDYNLSRDQMYRREKTYHGSYTQRMVDGRDAGVTNYYLPVYAADGCDDANDDGCVPELILWFFDSRGGKYYRTHSMQPDWVDASVVDWFNATSSRLAARFGRSVPSLAFVHIPIHATAALQKAGDPDGGGRLDPRRHPGINDEVPANGQAQGWTAGGRPTGEDADYGGQDAPFMEALAGARGLIALFYGHDHGNTWCYRWAAAGKAAAAARGTDVEGSGLHLCYGQHAGYGGYGNWVRGSRQVVVTRAQARAREADTHIRLESGDVVGAVTLNSTFNEDEYERTPDTKTMMRLSGASFESKAAAAAAADRRPMVILAVVVLSLLRFV